MTTHAGEVLAELLRGASDAELSGPLWWWPVADRPAVLSERAKRGILQIDPEPIGDSEYT